MASVYTEQDAAKMKSTYQKASTDEERKEAVTALATTLGRTNQSVISKLSRMKIYVKAAPVTKTGGLVTAKKEYVAAIRIMLNAQDSELTSLDKASKADLEKLTKLLTNASERVNVATGKSL